MSYNPNTTYIILQNNIGDIGVTVNNDIFYVSTINDTTYYSNSTSFGGFGGFPIFDTTGSLYSYVTQCIIGYSVTTLPANFIQQNTLTYLSIYSSGINIGSQAFYGCSSLNTVYIYSTQIITVDNDAFTGISNTAVLYTTSANINNTSLTQYFSQVVNLDNNTNYYIDTSVASFVDLNTIFVPYISGTSASATGFLVNNYGGITGQTDLNQIFAINNGTSFSNATNYIVENYAGNTGVNLDLCQIFAPIVTYTQTGATVSSSPTYNTILTFTGSTGTFQITNDASIQIYCEVVGPGGDGGDSYLNSAILYSAYGGGGGGAGGIVVNNNLIFSPGLYNITVGQSSGNASSIIGGTIKITANSGGNGAAADSISAGSGGQYGSGSGGTIYNSGSGGGGGGDGSSSNLDGSPGNSSSTMTQYGGGGGGGSSSYSDNQGTGGKGGTPYGGHGGGSKGGGDGISYGGGGGGGSVKVTGNPPFYSLDKSSPGSGYQGVVVLYFNV
jgi:hypothetical protein